jgi:hypothetical protein
MKRSIWSFVLLGAALFSAMPGWESWCHGATGNRIWNDPALHAPGGPPGPRPVPQWAIEKAVEFAGLDTVLSALSYHESSVHIYYYQVEGITHVDGVPREKIVSIDPKTEEPVELVLKCPRYPELEDEVLVQESQVLGIVEGFLEEHEIVIPDGFVLEETDEGSGVVLHQFGPEYFYEVRYVHLMDDVPVSTDLVLF